MSYYGCLSFSFGRLHSVRSSVATQLTAADKSGVRPPGSADGLAMSPVSRQIRSPSTRPTQERKTMPELNVFQHKRAWGHMRWQHRESPCGDRMFRNVEDSRPHFEIKSCLVVPGVLIGSVSRPIFYLTPCATFSSSAFYGLNTLTKVALILSSITMEAICALRWAIFVVTHFIIIAIAYRTTAPTEAL